MRALVVNCSAPHYNLGAAKLADYLRTEGYEVATWEGDPGAFAFGHDLVCLSVIFSWHAVLARNIAITVMDDSEVWCGGPGMSALKHWWQAETGLECVVGLDQRFERQRGRYRMTFAARGCPVGCWFCIVPKIEGKEFTLDHDFVPAPILCDNNLSALPIDFQEHILGRYRETGTVLKDANSGFEPRAFDEGTYERWRHQLRGPWRFAYDEVVHPVRGPIEQASVKRMLEILSPVRSRMKLVWVLVGNEPIDACYDRAMQVIGWGGEPWCQFVLPLNWLGDPAKLEPKHGWTYKQGRDFCRYFNTRGWRSYPISDYQPRIGELPFASLKGVSYQTLPTARINSGKRREPDSRPSPLEPQVGIEPTTARSQHFS